MQDQKQFTKKILNWFDQSGRKNLPWQQQITPYRVWVSEIMLQQTQVTTVIPYYQRFMQHYPDISSLARAPIDKVLHLWTGLGYYARARNLHHAAILIQHNFKGEFPLDFDAVVSLPGIGRSTAGAILAIADSQHHAILDGNVKRVLARFEQVAGWPGVKKVENQLWDIATHYTPKKQVEKYTQAIMDLGATVCTRSRPLCHACPVMQDCAACNNATVNEYPTPKPKKTLPVKQSVFLMMVGEDGKVLLEQRPPAGIWGGLWSFPECQQDTDIQDWCQSNFNLKIDDMQQWPTQRHTFSHYHLDFTPVLARVGEVHEEVDEIVPSIMESSERVWYNTLKPDELGLATPIKRLLGQLAQAQE